MMIFVDWHDYRDEVLTASGPMRALHWMEDWAADMVKHGRIAYVDKEGGKCRLRIDRLA
jgi:hypothetical protein